MARNDHTTNEHLRDVALAVTAADRAPTTPLFRALGVLLAIAGVLATMWTMLPHGSQHGDRIVLGVAACALGVGAVLSTGIADRMRSSWLHLLLLGGELLVTLAYVAIDAPSNDVRLFFLWIAPVACYAFRPRWAFVHITITGCLLGLGLGLQGSSFTDALRIWSMTMGTMLVIGLVVVLVAAVMRSQAATLERARHFDSLTGLANRAEFSRLADAALERRRRHGGRAVLFLTDLDRFKAVNDTQGHAAGDLVLVEIAAALRKVAPTEALVARLGGDEFAVLVEDPQGFLDLDVVAAAIASSWNDPLLLDGQAVHASACIGVATSAAGDISHATLLRDAEAAMLAAKKTGQGTISVFRLEQRADLERRYELEQGLHDAARLGQFHLVFQPVVELATGRLRAAEVLLRWTHPEMGEVSPAEFIPVAEDHGLVPPIGTWVLEESIAQLGAWTQAGIVPDDFRISINVSGHQLNADLPVLIDGLLRRHHVDAAAIMIELTETVIISASAETNETLTALRDMGLALVLDDFGTGFSSLAHLQRAKFDAVKIDRSFVRGVAELGTDRSIVGAILALAEALGISVVAEGVETRAQSEALRSLGCTLAQGYLFDRPLRADLFTSRMSVPTLRAVHTGPADRGQVVAMSPKAVGQS